jgi:hypothetical protein
MMDGSGGASGSEVPMDFLVDGKRSAPPPVVMVGAICPVHFLNISPHSIAKS